MFLIGKIKRRTPLRNLTLLTSEFCLNRLTKECQVALRKYVCASAYLQPQLSRISDLLVQNGYPAAKIAGIKSKYFALYNDSLILPNYANKSICIGKWVFWNLQLVSETLYKLWNFQRLKINVRTSWHTRQESLWIAALKRSRPLALSCNNIPRRSRSSPLLLSI